MAVICSGVGATTLAVCSSFGFSGDLGSSTTVNVLADCLLTSSIASVEANNSSASVLSYHKILLLEDVKSLTDEITSRKLQYNV